MHFSKYIFMLNTYYNFVYVLGFTTDAEPLPSARSAVNDDDSDDEPMVDKGKGPAIIVEPEHMEPQPSSGHERKESTASTTSQGLPTYDVLAQSGPAPQLDFDEFLKMTKPSPRAPRKN